MDDTKTPHELRGLELAQDGIWALQIERAAEPTVLLSRLRSRLGLDYSAVLALRARMQMGEVRGLRAEMEQLAHVIRESGGSAQPVRADGTEK